VFQVKVITASFRLLCASCAATLTVTVIPPPVSGTVVADKVMTGVSTTGGVLSGFTTGKQPMRANSSTRRNTGKE